jgi:hypothetical protein
MILKNKEDKEGEVKDQQIQRDSKITPIQIQK